MLNHLLGIITLGPKISKQVLKPKIKSIGYIIQSLPRDTQFGLENKQAAERIQKIIVVGSCKLFLLS